MKVKSITARQIFDSRGFPTVECDVLLEDGSLGRAAVPSGASTGSGEALELRDGNPEYSGKGVGKAIANIRDLIQPAIQGIDAWDQFKIDEILRELDGTENKSKLGANAILAVSLATAKAMANAEHKPLFQYIGQMIDNQNYTLPMPMLNILNGGKHAAGSTDIQEFMIIPVAARDFSHAMQMSSDTYHALGKVLGEKGYSTTVGDEGGYAPALRGGSEEALALIEEAIQKAGFEPGQDFKLALDVASSELVRDGLYDFEREGKTMTSEQLLDFYADLSQKYPLVSIEDGFGEDDWSGWRALVSRLGNKLQLVGDDLLVTNPRLLQRAIDDRAANAILIKPNQIGTLSETIEAVQMAKEAGWNVVISHRSGETEDTTIAHLAVGLSAGQIKTGSFSRSERVAKYNELLRIAEQLPSAPLAHPFQ